MSPEAVYYTIVFALIAAFWLLVIFGFDPEVW